MDASKPNKVSKFREDLTGTIWYNRDGKKIGTYEDRIAKAKTDQAKPSDKSDAKTK